MPEFDLSEIQVIAELDRANWKFEQLGGEQPQARVICPFHEDTTPSVYIYLDSRTFVCRAAGCKAHGDVISLFARKLGVSRAAIVADWAKRYTLVGDKIVEPEIIEKYHAAIWEQPLYLRELYKRGITDEDIREARLGYIAEEKRISIPVPTATGVFVNIRKYKPGAPSNEKMRSMRGRGANRIYPESQLQYDTVMLCGGELKALAAKRQLNRHSIGAISPTDGEGSWHEDFNHRIAGKKIIVCLDIDTGGKKESQKYAALLYKFAAWIGILELPLDAQKFPTGDINDYIGQCSGDLFPLLENVQQWQPPAFVSEAYGTPEESTLATAMQAINVGRRLAFPAVVSAVSTAPYAIPKTIEVLCDRSADVCGACPVMMNDKNEWELQPEAKALLSFIGTDEKTHGDAIKAGIGVPLSCRVCAFNTVDFYHAEEIRVSPPQEITSLEIERNMQPAIVVGSKRLELNESYRFVGRMYPHPKNSEATLLLSEWETTKDALSTYVCRDLERLDAFQPSEWTVDGIAAKLDEIYADFETNVTRIYQRRDLHAVVDLFYHSPLFFNFQGALVNGWVQALVVGDSSQGKSEIACGSTAAGRRGLMGHYDLGEKMECKNATVAGIIGGLQHMGNKWLVTWGAIPNNDKRALIMDEVKGLPVDFIGKLTSLRTDGRAELVKIEKRIANARTRLLWLSNARDGRNGIGRQMSLFNFGVEACVELIGALEDIRRFDICYIADCSDVDTAVINLEDWQRPQIEHRYTGELCRALILWGWTRSATQVQFDPDAVRAVLAEANELCGMFTQAIPIIDRGSTRFKIAKLAASLACRTFSHTDEMLSIRVRECHVRYIANFLRMLYSRPTFGYLEYTKAINSTDALRDIEHIKKRLQQLPTGLDVCRSMLYTTAIELQDLQDWSGSDRMISQDLLGFLVRKNALKREGRAYGKSPAFIGLLRHLVESNQFAEVPEHLRKASEF